MTQAKTLKCISEQNLRLQAVVGRKPWNHSLHGGRTATNAILLKNNFGSFNANSNIDISIGKDANIIQDPFLSNDR